MPNGHSKSGSRIEALDYLRGFFILVIIIDHLDRWPSLLSLITGQDSLWASAAEGFVIISGLLLGYVRGYKARASSFKSVSRIVLKRAVILYIWVVLCTLLLSVATWYVPFQGSIAYVDVPVGQWGDLFHRVLTLDFVHVLPYFLYLYAIFLALSPLALLLLRRRLWWIVIIGSSIGWAIGTALSIQWLQWLPVFFIATTAGYHLETIRDAFASLQPSTRRLIRALFVTITVITIGLSAGPFIGSLDQFFGRSPLDVWRILIAGIWFVGLLFIFQWALPFIRRYLAWLLHPFGSRSLTAYIVHSLPLMAVAFLFPVTTNLFVNTCLGVVSVLATWGLLRLKIVQRIVPR